MPVLDGNLQFLLRLFSSTPSSSSQILNIGVAATEQMRRIEAEFGLTTPERPRPTKILALTGMSSLEDKRRAFEAGVDG